MRVRSEEERLERIRASKAAYRERNRETLRRKGREHSAQMRDARKPYFDSYREANRERLRIKGRDYYAAHKEQFAAYKDANREAIAQKAKAHYFANHSTARAKANAWRLANQEKVKATKALAYIANRPKVLAKSSAYRQANREAVRARNRAYLARFPEEHRLRAKKRAAVIRGARTEPISLCDLKAKLAEYGGLCAYCQEAPHGHWDHFIPVKKGGPHSLANLIPSCPPCNLRKRTNLWPYPAPPVMVHSPS